MAHQGILMLKNCSRCHLTNGSQYMEEFVFLTCLHISIKSKFVFHTIYELIKSLLHKLILPFLKRRPASSHHHFMRSKLGFSWELLYHPFFKEQGKLLY